MKNPRTSPDYVSKSQRKRDANALLDLCAQLVKLPQAKLNRVPLGEDLREAVNFTRSINARVARKRQLHFLAKLMRRIDATPIYEALEAEHTQSRQLTARQHRVEAWRDALLGSGDTLVADLCRQCPGVDAQSLRQLIRNAQRESSLGKPPGSARTLFRLLRDLDSEETLPPVS
jgi:ribosome-associated protein